MGLEDIIQSGRAGYLGVQLIQGNYCMSYMVK